MGLIFGSKRLGQLGKIPRINPQQHAIRLGQDHAGVIAVHRPPHIGRDGAQQCTQVQIRRQRIVQIQQEPEAVAFLSQCGVQFAGLLVCQYIVDRHGDLAGYLSQKLDVGVGIVVRPGVAEAYCAQTPVRRRQRLHATGMDGLVQQQPKSRRIARVLGQVAHHQRRLRAPH